MKRFNLKVDTIGKIEKILKDYNITEADIICSSQELGNYDEILETINKALLNSKSAQPLFSNNNYFDQNVVMATIFKNRIKKIQDKEEVEDFNFSFLEENLKEINFIVNGEYIISVFKESFIDIDYSKYGFNYADDLFYCLGAYFSNVCNYTDKREIMVSHKDIEGIVSYYDNHIHGDFRISQFDISKTTMINPFEEEFEEKLPFGICEKNYSLAGYHSVESVFLAGLLYFSLSENIELPVLNDFNSFYNKLTEKNQEFGNYSDAGYYHKSSSLIPYLDMRKFGVPSIPIEFGGSYNGKVKDGVLYYYIEGNEEPSLVIYAEMVNDLIKGLFIKVHNGNGRSSTAELTDCINYFKDLYYDKKTSLI